MGCVNEGVQVPRSEDNVNESVFSFHWVGPGGQTQIPGFGSKLLYLLSHFTDPHKNHL